MNNLITLTTDFGLGEYTAAMKGVILGINSQGKIIDINHKITAQNIKEAAYVMYSAVPYFPWAVHVGVVDPGVGTNRKGIVIQCENGLLVGPDNGLLIPCARKLGIRKIYEISNKKYMNDVISNTFHGRDIFAPAAAYLSIGISAEEMGEEISDFVNLRLSDFEEGENTVRGHLLHIDNFGNIIFSIPEEIVLKHVNFGDEVDFSLENSENSIARKISFLPCYAQKKPRELLATISSSGFLEIACNQGSAFHKLKMTSISRIVMDF
jgi:S-adenosylmethionine hydrolase